MFVPNLVLLHELEPNSSNSDLTARPLLSWLAPTTQISWDKMADFLL